MADISVIKLPSGTSYNIKDSAARADIETLKGAVSGGMHYLGVTTSAITDGATTNPIRIGDKDVTAKAGDIVIYGSLEFVFSTTDNKWHEFGSTGSLKALAFKDNASGKTTPTGTVSKPTFTGTQGSVSVSGTPTGSIGVGDGTANYTPSGTLTGGAISVELNSSTKYVASSATGGGSVSNGSAASCTLPSLTTTVEDETLTLGWSAGSFKANTPTSVTLPSFTSATVASSVKSASITTEPTFNGNGAELTFSGDNMTSTGNYTPSGSVSQPTFTGNEATVTVS